MENIITNEQINEAIFLNKKEKIEESLRTTYRKKIWKNFIKAIKEFDLIKDGDKINFGEYNFEVIDLSGHTPGQVGIYDKNHKILFSGDHILNKITPNISFWDFKYEDILGTYLKNLDKVYNMEVDTIYSAHRGIIDNPKFRIDELKKHYADRNAEVYNLLKEVEENSAAQMAAKMHWDYRAKNFEEFPNNQKWFATGEALANLEHLRAIGKADYEFKDRATSELTTGKAKFESELEYKNSNLYLWNFNLKKLINPLF